MCNKTHGNLQNVKRGEIFSPLLQNGFRIELPIRIL